MYDYMRAQEEMALAGFIAGFHLAWGIATELGAVGSYAYEHEWEEINRRKNCGEGADKYG